MSGRYIGTALTLGGAFVAMVVLTSGPSEAKRAHFKKGAFVGSKALRGPATKTPRFSHKRTFDPTSTDPKSPKDPGIGKLPPYASQPNPTKVPDVVKDVPGIKPPKLPPIASSEPNPTKVPDIVKGSPQGAFPSDGSTSFPKPTSSIEVPDGVYGPPGAKPPKLPPVVSSEPLPPKFPPTTPGSLPPIGGSVPYGGGAVIVGGTTGGDETLPGLSKDKVGGPIVLAESGTPTCDPCEWLRESHLRTGLAKWLDRYRQCLLWQRGS